MHKAIIPFGPQHPAIKEPAFLKLGLEDNIVSKVELNFGFMHKGIEKLLEGSQIQQALVQAEMVCGICSQTHSQCYTNTIEKMLDLSIPEKARLQRMIVSELERTHSHLIWNGLMMHEIGLQTLFMLFWRERERILDCFDVLTGGRVHHAVNAIGSTKYDFQEKDLKLVQEKTAQVEKFVEGHLGVVEKHDVIVSRFKDKGVISREKARELDLVGPNARSSGLKTDVRKDFPYELYQEMDFNLITEKNGDVFDRMIVRLREILESIKIINQCIKRMKLKEKILEPKLVNYSLKDAFNLSRTEAPRGELLYFIEIKDDVVQRAKIRTPTCLYMDAFPFILTGIDITDVPVNLESMDPCFSCMERAMVVKGQEEMTLGAYLKKLHGGKHWH